MKTKLVYLWCWLFAFTIVKGQAGSLDLTFDIGLGSNTPFSSKISVAIQQDEKIIVVGNFTEFSGIPKNRIVRLNSDGSIDNDFNIGTGFNNHVTSVVIQSDGKIVVGGSFTQFNGLPKYRMARLNNDGSIDNTFNISNVDQPMISSINKIIILSNGKFLIEGGFWVQLLPSSNTTKGLAILNSDGSVDNTFSVGSGSTCGIDGIPLEVLSNGKILYGGCFTSFNGVQKNRLVMLNSNGTIDNSFNIGSGLDSYVSDISVQNDGKIIVGGSFTSFNGIGRNYIARLNQDGSLDSSFDPGTGFNSLVYSTTIQADGKIIVGGDFTSFNGTAVNRIVRLNVDGTLDFTLNSGSGFNSNVRSTTLQSDGKIIVGGNFTFFNGTSRNYIARLNNDGSLDEFFNPNTGFNNIVFSTSVQADGKIIVGGLFTSFNGIGRNYIARLNQDGSHDSSFDPGTGFNDVVWSTSIKVNDQIIVGGSFTSFNGSGKIRVVLLNQDGSVDNSFNPSTGSNLDVLAIAIQQNGKIILGGDFTSYNNLTKNRIVRINEDGSLDETFDVGTGVNGRVEAIDIQSDGKIIIVGNFTFYNGTSRNRIARLNNDGSLDGTFSIGVGANAIIRAIYIQPDGKIIVAGDFTSYNGTSRNRIARLNSDGSLDLSFNVGIGPEGTVTKIMLQPDGKIIVGGAFTSFNGLSKNRITRLNENGSEDLSFNIGSGANGVIRSILLQPDGKIILGGQFTLFNSTPKNYIVRLNSNGSIDSNFDIGLGANSWVWSSSLTADGKIILGGTFTSYNGTLINRIARLNADGTIDLTFNPGTGANSTVWTTALQSDGKIIIGGGFISYSGIGRNRIARIFGDGTVCVTVNGTDEIASCVPITWIDGNTYSTSNNTATHLLVGAAQNGCDSLVTLNFTLLNSATSTDVINSCAPITWIDGNTYSVTNNTATFNIIGGAANGCDSLVTLNFTLWPCTQLNAAACGAIGVTMSQIIRAVDVSAAAYRFRVTGPNNAGSNWNGNTTTYITPIGQRHFRFSLIPGCVWGATYQVEVAAGDGSGNFGPYGAACNVTLEGAIPTSAVRAITCGTSVTATQFVRADNVNGAVAYRFRITGTNSSSWANNELIFVPANGDQKFRFVQIQGALPGTTYMVDVAIQSANGTWGAYGSACPVTLAGLNELVVDNNELFVSNKTLETITFDANASHNPFTTEFGIQVLNANDSETINVAIYDMSGKLIERNAVNPMDIEAAKFGSNLASGMYLIEVRQGSNQAVIRQVKN